MTNGSNPLTRLRVFGLTDWTEWLEDTAGALYGLSAADFEDAYMDGRFHDDGRAGGLIFALEMIQRLRERPAV